MSVHESTSTFQEWRDGPIPNETWRDVTTELVGFPVLPVYQISNMGRLRSRMSNSGRPASTWRVLSGAKTRWGYQVFNLRDGTPQGRVFFAHRLVAFAFIGQPPFDGAEVRHLDGNPQNNIPNNLAWGTSEENAADRLRHGRVARGSKCKKSSLNSEMVLEVVRLWREGMLRKDIAKRVGVSGVTVGHIVSGKSWGSVTGLHRGHPDASGPSDRSRWQSRGERNNSVLTSENVLEIVQRCRSGESGRSVAKRFGIGHTTVRRILSGKKWRHVTGLGQGDPPGLPAGELRTSTNS